MEKGKKATTQRKTKYFGTDGFRGEFGKELLPKHAFLIGRFLGWYCGERLGISAKILIGKDTRYSSSILEKNLISGITQSGADAYPLGVIPTPALSYLVSTEHFDAGVMITASHNPHKDNGIKVIGFSGEKLDDEATQLLEDYIDGRISDQCDSEKDLPSIEGGRTCDFSQGVCIYEEHLARESVSLSELRIGLDCANGATYKIAPRIFSGLGAEVYTVGTSPDGTNINLGVGSTHIENLQKLVKENGLDMGFAFDGDGDRCIGVDRSGEVIDGDREMLILAKALKENGQLADNTLVTTVMSNKGLEIALYSDGIQCQSTPVGDRFVYDKMMEAGYSLGGEQSGHIIIRKYAKTGDGILTALCLADRVKKTQKSLLELSEGFIAFPQINESIEVSDKERITKEKELVNLYRRISDEIGNDGRILLRKSGTENLIRVMVEHKNIEKCKQYVDILSDLIKEIDKSYG